jgi:hypothetical protein
MRLSFGMLQQIRKARQSFCSSHENEVFEYVWFAMARRVGNYRKHDFQAHENRVPVSTRIWVRLASQ